MGVVEWSLSAPFLPRRMTTKSEGEMWKRRRKVICSSAWMRGGCAVAQNRAAQVCGAGLLDERDEDEVAA